MSTQITGAQRIVNGLIKHNVKNVFGISGGSIMPVIDQFYRNDKINLFINSHEQHCGHAATGYAKSSNKTENRLSSLSDIKTTKYAGS